MLGRFGADVPVLEKCALFWGERVPLNRVNDLSETSFQISKHFSN